MGPQTTLQQLKEEFGRPPMNLVVKEKVLQIGGVSDHVVIFSYNQVETKFGDSEHGGVCKECRGIILRMGTFDVVCYAFDKFFNSGEGNADEVDWAAAVVQEKLDGSLMKLWYSTVLRTWVLSTNNSIDAFDARTGPKSFGELFEEAAAASGLDRSRLMPSRSYCFELLHPESTVVINHPRPRLVHLGTRDMESLQEVLDDDIGIERPRVFPLADITSCLAAAQALPSDMEGFVVVDRSTLPLRVRRVKIKSPTYVAFHHLKGNGSPDEATAMVLLCNETEEVKAYGDLVEVRGVFGRLEQMRVTQQRLIERLEVIWTELMASLPEDERAQRKHFALAVQQYKGMPQTCSGLLFHRVQLRLGQSVPEAALPSVGTMLRESFAKPHAAGYDAKAFLKLLAHPWVVANTSLAAAGA